VLVSMQLCACKWAALCHNTFDFLMLQEDAEDREVVAAKLASAKAWLADLRKQQRQLDADKKHLDAEMEELDAEKEQLEAEEDRLVVRNSRVAKGL